MCDVRCALFKSALTRTALMACPRLPVLQSRGRPTHPHASQTHPTTPTCPLPVGPPSTRRLRHRRRLPRRNAPVQPAPHRAAIAPPYRASRRPTRTGTTSRRRMGKAQMLIRALRALSVGLNLQQREWIDFDQDQGVGCPSSHLIARSALLTRLDSLLNLLNLSDSVPNPTRWSKRSTRTSPPPPTHPSPSVSLLAPSSA
jgi:hypothetical protein